MLWLASLLSLSLCIHLNPTSCSMWTSVLRTWYLTFLWPTVVSRRGRGRSWVLVQRWSWFCSNVEEARWVCWWRWRRRAACRWCRCRSQRRTSSLGWGGLLMRLSWSWLPSQCCVQLRGLMRFRWSMPSLGRRWEEWCCGITASSSLVCWSP